MYVAFYIDLLSYSLRELPTRLFDLLMMFEELLTPLKLYFNAAFAPSSLFYYAITE